MVKFRDLSNMTNEALKYLREEEAKKIKLSNVLQST